MIFFADLDNTLIYSYKHDIGDQKVCAEVYQGREISFLTERTQALLVQVSHYMCIVPTTTRTVEQYQRVRLGIGEIPYALVCNGGVLLAGGAEDEQWYRETLEMTAKSREELKKAEAILTSDTSRCFEVRNIRDLFVFTKSSRPERSVQRLAAYLDASRVAVFSNGVKVYAVPVGLNKGTALKRLSARLGADRTIAAGDSAFDIPMLECADYAFAPEKLAVHMGADSRVIRIREQDFFSECLLEHIIQLVKQGDKRERP